MLKFASAAAFALAAFSAGQPGASETAPALSPLGVVTPAGSHVLFYDRTRLLVLDPSQKESAQWRALLPPDESVLGGELQCSADGKGLCVVGLVKQDEKRLGIVSAERAQITDTEIVYQEILAVGSARQIYISRSRANGSRQVFSVDAEAPSANLIGTLSRDERFVLLPIDGVLTPGFVSGAGKVRFAGSDGQASISSGIFNGRSTSASGVFIANDLFQKYADGRDKAIFGLGEYSRKGTGELVRSFDGFETVFPSESMPLPPLYAIDRLGNAVGLMAREDGLDLIAPCVVSEADGKSRRASKQIRTFPNLTQIGVYGSGRGEGIVLRVRRPGETENVLYVRFEGAVPARFGGLACDALKVAMVPLRPIPGTSMPQGWKESVHEMVLQDGTKIAGTLLRQEGVPTRRLIVDVYGASGLLRSQLDVPNAFLESDEMRGTAIYYPVLPGDGNFGWSFSSASRSPERGRAVNALAELVALAKSELLASGGKLYLRGGSAGGWLAIKTALSRPGLVDEVISISGAYSFEPEDDGIKLADFFRVEDSIASGELANCGTTFFRLIHGTEDAKIPFARVQKFGQLMSANKCKGALHIAEGGTHNLTNFTTFKKNPETRKLMNWAYGID
ncbi:hypothetical protein [Porphyrobacter sp. YT40]|uniref:alpha/beta hydrolase family protein n=1 Tax=Porphyrobacter sp. YT40 TaxID=2547601 RepID=UPI0011449FD9|nr:hypothetical protein [Porphyrobacter sp. YT40]QDH35107.1 hypothetical protein E2E27_12715 [Porphyrobacter sp. YT40]